VNGQEISDLTGFLIMDSETDPRESIVLTFWKSKESMIAFYNKENPTLTGLVNKLKPLFSEMPVRIDYKVTSFKAT
jgi:heme-degrading monooxygenase HmoA